MPGGASDRIRIGLALCLEPGLSASAQWQECTATDATCDGVDDDCDGIPDDDHLEFLVTCGVGVCQQSAIARCQEGIASYTCEPLAPESTNDPSCNGVDEDCDGSVDEDFAPLATLCGMPYGARGGLLECADGELIHGCAGADVETPLSVETVLGWLIGEDSMAIAELLLAVDPDQDGYLGQEVSRAIRSIVWDAGATIVGLSGSAIGHEEPLEGCTTGEDGDDAEDEVRDLDAAIGTSFYSSATVRQRMERGSQTSHTWTWNPPSPTPALLDMQADYLAEGCTSEANTPAACQSHPYAEFLQASLTASVHVTPIGVSHGP